jgi:hypothetical protein
MSDETIKNLAKPANPASSSKQNKMLREYVDQGLKMFKD